jgi:hypothetical protein
MEETARRGVRGPHTASKAKKTSFESKEVGGIKLAQKSALVSERRHLPKHELAFIGETLATLKHGGRGVRGGSDPAGPRLVDRL